MKQFCQYLSFLHHVFRHVLSLFIGLLLGLFTSISVNANNASLACGLSLEQHTFGALPEFTANSQPLTGYTCDLKPRRSSYKGNWFPSLPQLSFSQSQRLLNQDNNTPEADDYSQSWYLDFAIKRIGHSQLVIHGGQKKRQQTLTANEEIPFFPTDASSVQDVITIQQQQKARLIYTESKVGLSFIFPYREHQPLTRLNLQHYEIAQPIQANIVSLPKRSLYNAQVRLTEVGISSHSYHRGLNLNWGLALAAGDIRIDSEVVTQNTDNNEILSILGNLELFYQYRFNRRWFGFTRWQGELRYWRQGKSDNPDFQLAEANNIEQQIQLGLGFSF